MRSLVCIMPGQFEYQTAEKPERKKHHSIIQIKRIGICGTDLHAFEGTQPYFEYPRILGHELAAIVDETEQGSGFIKGEAISIIPYFNCGHCIACTNGKPNCCVHMQVCGVHVHGGMTTYLSVPNYSILKGNGLNFDELALIEPLAIGAHGVARAGVVKDEYVLVVGAGPIGLGIIEFVKIAGAHVIALDVNERRLSFCKEKLLVRHTINGRKENVMERLKEITTGNLPTVVVDATGNLKAINSSFEYLAHGGRYVMVGLQKGDITFSHPEFHKREATLMSSRNATRADFEFVLSCIQKEMIDPAVFITHKFPFETVKDNFKSLLHPESGVIKAIIEME